MANADASFGFRPVMHRSGAPYNGAANLYMATNGTAMYVGDAIFITGQSNATEIEGNPPGSVPIITQAATTNTTPISGVVVGIVPTSRASTTYRAASKVNTLVWVCDDPNVQFEVQCDTTVTQEDIGNACSLVTTNSGSTVTGRSGQEVGTIATQGQFVIERLVPKANNDLASANSVVLVTCRRHTKGTMGAQTSGFGVGIA